MKKILKKILATTLVLSMAASMSAVNVFAAAEGETIPQESIPEGAVLDRKMSVEEQLQMILAQCPSTVSSDGADQREMAIKKAEIASAIERNVQTYALGDNFNPSVITQKILAVPYYKQDNGHYCGPATLKQTLQYINGSSLSQKTYASSNYLNTDNTYKTDENGKRYYYTTNTKMLSTVNSLQSRLKYYENDVDTANRLLYYVWEDMTTYNAPTILILKTTDSDDNLITEWSYRTSGHFMSAVGVAAKGTDIRVTDPYIEYIFSKGEEDGTYWMKTENVYEAVISHPCTAVQW